MSGRRSMRLASALAFSAAISDGTDDTLSPLTTQRIRVQVQVPPGTKDDAIYLTGSLPAVGNWRADGVRLNRQNDGTYVGELRLRFGARFEFKLNRRGDWASVEKSYDGSERPNRTAAVEASLTCLDLSVERWAE